MGESDDRVLNDSLVGATCAAVGDAYVLLAVITHWADFVAALAAAKQHPNLFLWCVCGRGSAAEMGDTAIRAMLREQGDVDSKSCAVSSGLTATRYRRPEKQI